MGYWEQSETGASFSWRDGDGAPFIWGDTPADIVGAAINGVVAAFLHDVGRLPSRGELMAGITFSTAVLGLPDRPEDVPDVSEEDLAIIREHYYAAVHAEEPGASTRPKWRIEAEQAVGEVIARLTEPYRNDSPADPTMG